MPAGRPLKFESVEQLETAIRNYFSNCDTNKRPKTITGLAIALDIDRKTIVNYAHKDEFFLTIKRARLQCENYVEEGLLTGKVPAAAGIFNLKNNYDWKDETHQNITLPKPILDGVSSNNSPQEDTEAE